MKNKKLKLSELKVQSFVTNLDKKEKATLAGGDNTANPACLSNNPICNSAAPACNTLPEFCHRPYSCGFPYSDCPPPPDNTMLC